MHPRAVADPPARSPSAGLRWDDSPCPLCTVADAEPLFEAADPLAEALYAARPFASYAALISRATRMRRSPRSTSISVRSVSLRIAARPYKASSDPTISITAPAKTVQPVG